MINRFKKYWPTYIECQVRKHCNCCIACHHWIHFYIAVKMSYCRLWLHLYPAIANTDNQHITR